jgi:hypothetical protein
MPTNSRDIAAELKQIMRLAGRSPDALEHGLPALSALHRVRAATEVTESARVHFILYQLIPEYLTRLPGSRDCRAIRELMTWEGPDGELHSLTTRYHKAAAHLVYAASDFGRRQEPRLLHECARRFVRFDHEDRLAAAPICTPSRTAAGPGVANIEARPTSVGHLPLDNPDGETGGDPGNPDPHQLMGGEDNVLANACISGSDILAEALATAVSRGATILVLMLHAGAEPRPRPASG